MFKEVGGEWHASPLTTRYQTNKRETLGFCLASEYILAFWQGFLC